MTYDRESYEKVRGDETRLGEESIRGEVEEEPSELDKPEGIYDEDLEEEDLKIGGQELDDEDDEDEEPASPLAEDAPVKQGRGAKKKSTAPISGRAAREVEQDSEGLEAAITLQDDGDLDESEVRTSGGSEAEVMSQSERKREFPSVARESRGPGKRRDDPSKGGRRSRGRTKKPARA